ncbi:MAG: hypothetical protein HY712_02010 [candidate division NC10 bacterium]|nr:hypothetical protein [candidate division NC10 bacterium]
MRPTLAWVLGDPAGIGPEIVVKSLTRADILSACRPVVVGPADVAAAPRGGGRQGQGGGEIVRSVGTRYHPPGNDSIFLRANPEGFQPGVRLTARMAAARNQRGNAKPTTDK